MTILEGLIGFCSLDGSDMDFRTHKRLSMKKISIFMLALAMAFPMMASVVYERGDVNQSGDVTIADVTTLIDYLLSNEWPAPSGPVHEFVDLGLSSGTLWATTNVGATNPEDNGDYFAWGEIVPNKETYTWATTAWAFYENGALRFSKYNTDSQYGEIDNKTELDPEDDAAYANWGSEWRMPTKAQLDELRTQCTWVWTEVNGVSGQMLTGPSGNSIFLPAAGQRSAANLSGLNSNGNYWSRELYVASGTVKPNSASKLYFGKSSKQTISGARNQGCSVRPVYASQDVPTSDYERGDVNQDGGVTIADVTTLIDYLLSNVWPDPIPVVDYVDLGLPSGILWATHNVGANNPEELGDFFAWGETAPKANYVWEGTAFLYVEDGQKRISKYNTKSDYGPVDNKIELEPEDDAAYVNMGSEWRMPSKADIDELLANCTWEWTQLNGVNGQLITGPNGNTMFLPAVGERMGTSIFHLGEAGNYWSRSLYVVNETVSFPTAAYKIYLTDADGLTWNSADRNCGFPVRAVRVAN